ncbi:MAG: hypothetical protein NC400_11035 [Clostridium sp.]|nr:hypothetical protein [Clostridium sp.]
MEQKSEVIAMSIYEYNEEYVRKTLFEDGWEEGQKEGIKEGERKSRIFIARQMLKEGMEKETVIRLTRCSEEEGSILKFV